MSAASERLGGRPAQPAELLETVLAWVPAGVVLFESIVREIVSAHGGQVEVASSEADGTTFTVRLPREARQDEAP